MPRTNRLLKIPRHNDFTIPIFFSDDAKASYLHQLKKRFQKAYAYLDSCTDIDFAPSIKSNVLARVEKIQALMLQSIDQYLSGHPSKAYGVFKDMLDSCQLRDEVASLKQHKVPKHSFLFRAQRHYTAVSPKRANSEGFLQQKQVAELFHPPFQKRRTVSTNRFSISGYPCLYLSENVLTSFSECFPDKSNKSVNFHVIALQNVRPLYFINLSDTSFNEHGDGFPGIAGTKTSTAKNNSDILGHIGVHHLVMASHTKIDYRPSYKGEQYYFKAEYIIPQLLLQWLKEEGYAIDGIRYRSCTGYRRFPGTTEHYNYVLPVQSNLEKGFCPSLYAAFRFTPVYDFYAAKPPSGMRKRLAVIAEKLKAAPLSPM